MRNNPIALKEAVMTAPLHDFWSKKLEKVQAALISKGFMASVVQDAQEAKALFMADILPGLQPKTVAFGGSVTFMNELGLADILRSLDNIELIDAYTPGMTPEQGYELRRRSLLADLFVTGTNAIVSNGALVNLDGTGNRVAAITFGPRHVVLFVGRNKIVDSLDEAFSRVRNVAAPINAMRLKRKTPCAASGMCADCNSPDRICNQWGVIVRCAPVNRIHVVLINENLGY